MKIKLYSPKYDMKEKIGMDAVKNKESYISWYLQKHPHKLIILAFLIKHIKENNFKNILSLGSGCCVLEYLLKLSLPDLKVVASDNNSYLIKTAQTLFPNITVLEFDFCQWHYSLLDGKFDVAVFFGSSYMMSEDTMTRQLRSLKMCRIKHIVIFEAGFLTNKECYKLILSSLKRSPILRKLFGKLPLKPQERNHQGYAYSRGALRRIYRNAGLKVIKETRMAGYKYVSILG